MTENEVTVNKDDMLADVPDIVRDQPVGPMIGIAAIALNMALKYADINTVQDGALYQQYKLEGRNMQALHLAYVLHIATQMEEHLVAANKRVAQMIVVSALADETEDAAEVVDAEPSEPSAPTDTQS